MSKKTKAPPAEPGPSKRARMSAPESQEDTIDSEHRPGSIVRIKLENFVTYDEAEYFPGPNLNMILGPNGTGKSTLVCAICLGLGGRTSLLGRSKDIKEFVKHGKENATIEVELKGKNGNPNIIVKRELSKRNNNSTWRLNGTRSTEASVLETIKANDVQVENLIQFLPQDRVAEFAQLTPSQVLVETEKATGGIEMYEKHTELIEMKKEAKNLQTNFDDDEKKIQGLERKNNAIEPQVIRYRERQSFQKKIELIKRKKPWIEYEKERTEYFAARDERKAKEEELKRVEAANKPMKDKLKALEEALRGAENQKKEYSARYKKLFDSLPDKDKKIENEENEMDEIMAEIEDMKKAAKEKVKKVQTLENEVNKIKSKIENEKPTGDLNELQRQLDEKNVLLRNFQTELMECQGEQKMIRDEQRKAAADINQAQKKLEQLENIASQRLKNLKNYQPGTYNAVVWLRENRHLFKDVVYEPVVLMVDVKDTRYAKEIESCIPKNSLWSFLCRSKEDHNTLIQKVCEEQKLQINASTTVTTPLENFHRTPQHKLEQYGFQNTLIDFVEAPNDIKAYLCETSRLHEIPVTKSKVKEEKIVQENAFFRFFADDQSYNVTRSKYGDRTASTTTRGCPPARNLSVSVDAERKNMLLNEIASHREREATLAEKLNEIFERERAIREKDEPIRQERERLLKEKDRIIKDQKQITLLKVQLESKEEQLRKMREEVDNQNVEAQEAKLRNKHKAIAVKRSKLALDAMQLRLQLLTIQRERTVASLEVMQKLQILNDFRNELETTNVAYERAQKEFHDAHELAETKKRLAKNKLKEAEKFGKPTEEMQEAFQELPNDIDELNALLEDHVAKLSSTDHDDARVVKEYENRKEEIEELKRELEKRKAGLYETQSRLDGIENSWRPTVETMVAKISASFTEFMKKLGCVGECRLATDEDYSKWGIEILVKFRDSETLHVLTRQRQSGGERAVSTILYLMALQDMARSPFRVVDEINQGMDPKNERLVHSIIAETATQPNTSQYFLVTPKLLPDLEYNEKMKILCIFNGEHQPDYKEWRIQKFIERLREKS